MPKKTPSNSRDPLDITVRELLSALANRDRDWIDIRCEPYPWKYIIAAAERGECEVRIVMRRAELDRFMKSRRIKPKKKVASR